MFFYEGFIHWRDRIYDIIGNVLNVEVKKAHVATDFLAACDPSYFGGLVGDKSNSVVFENGKIKRLVPDFVATTRFDQGVRLSIEYFLAHQELQVPDEEFDQFCDRVIKAQEEALKFFKSEV